MKLYVARFQVRLDKLRKLWRLQDNTNELFNPFMPNGISHSYLLDQSISVPGAYPGFLEGGRGFALLILSSFS